MSDTRSSATDELAGRRVTVVGLGRFGGGVGATRWLAGQGARVTVSDAAPPEKLADSIRQLDGLDVALHLGGHDEADFLDAELLVVSPAVPPEMLLLKAARAAGVPCTTEINLFLQRCRAPVAGITGTVGKSTTTAMLGEILARRFTAHVGGNIGRSLLGQLDAIRPDHVVVLELSSFQLEALPRVGISPHVAVVTNLLPNHLDRHGTMDAYAAAKRNIFAFQKPSDVLVLNRDCPVTSQWAAGAAGRVEWFEAGGEPFDLIVPGRHNQINAQAAWTAAEAFGAAREDASAALLEFAGLPHRLKFLAERDGVRYYNDSKCTTPQGAEVALDAFEPRRAIILLGGYDKQVSFDSLGAAAAARAKGVVALGATARQIVAAVEAHRAGELPRVERAGDFPSAVAAARALAGPGDVVLLSPACASYDMFTNYEERGDRFAALVTGDR